MARFVFVPHSNGFGHRVRCDALGRALLAYPDVDEVRLLLRKNDSAADSRWTALPVTRTRFGRAFHIVTARVLIEDGFLFQTIPTRLMRWIGGKLVLIVQPSGFAKDSPLNDVLDAADLVLVPYPRELFRPAPPLDGHLDRIRVVDPIGSLETISRNPEGQSVVYCEVSRPTEGFRAVVEAACSMLSASERAPFRVAGGFGELLPSEEHAEQLSRAQVVVTQGMTAAFEAIRLGIPTVVVPRQDVPEQVATAEQLAAAGWATVVSPGALSPENLAAAILRASADTSHRDAIAQRGSGLAEAVRLLRETARLPPEPINGPWLSVVSTNYNCGHALLRHLQSIYRQWPEEEFEYLLVDNHSKDNSRDVLTEWAAEHPNFRWKTARSSVGKGRDLAARESIGSYLLVVDTDTVYRAVLHEFVRRAIDRYPDCAVQAIYAGVFPHYLWRVCGGRGDFNVGEDLEMWMRIHELGKMRWYPIKMGENVKEPWARDASDLLSSRYTRAEKLLRLARMGFDRLRLSRFDSMDLRAVWMSSTVDLHLGIVEPRWFGESGPVSARQRVAEFLRAARSILQP